MNLRSCVAIAALALSPIGASAMQVKGTCQFQGCSADVTFCHQARDCTAGMKVSCDGRSVFEGAYSVREMKHVVGRGQGAPMITGEKVVAPGESAAATLSMEGRAPSIGSCSYALSR